MTVFGEDGTVIAGSQRGFRSGFDGILHDEGNGLFYFKLISGGRVFVSCVPETMGKHSVKLVQAYFVESTGASGVELSLSAFLKNGLSLPEQVALDEKLKDKIFYPILLVTDSVDKRVELTEYLGAIKSDGDFVCSDEHAIVLIKSAEHEYSSGEELCDVLYEAIKQEEKVDLKIGYGGRSTSLVGLRLSVKRGYEAIKYLGKTTDVCAYKSCAEQSLYESLTPETRASYLGFILDGMKSPEVLSDPELVTTARCLMQNSLSLTLTAKQLFVHRNTLTHRINKIKDGCGLDLRNYSDARVFETVVAVYETAKRNGEI